MKKPLTDLELLWLIDELTIKEAAYLLSGKRNDAQAEEMINTAIAQGKLRLEINTMTKIDFTQPDALERMKGMVDTKQFKKWRESLGFDAEEVPFQENQAKPINLKNEISITKNTLPKQWRQDSLAVELDEILNGMTNRTPSIVMAKLKQRIGEPYTCVIENTGDGIKWESNLGDIKLLNIKALTERIRGWKKKHNLN